MRASQIFVTKEKTKWSYWTIFRTGILISLAALFIFLIYHSISTSPVFTLFMDIVRHNLFWLCRLAFYIFLACSTILLLMGHWVGWDNIRFRVKQKKYRHSIITKDYFKNKRKMKGNFVSGAFMKMQNRTKLETHFLDDPVISIGDLDADAGPFFTKLEYKNSKLHGEFKAFYSNGKIAEEMVYANGKINGHYRSYYTDGALHSERFYLDGKLHGVFRAFDDDGSIFFEITYRNGIQEGADRTFYKSGVVEYEDTYAQGKRIKRKTFAGSGELLFEQEF